MAVRNYEQLEEMVAAQQRTIAALESAVAAWKAAYEAKAWPVWYTPAYTPTYTPAYTPPLSNQPQCFGNDQGTFLTGTWVGRTAAGANLSGGHQVGHGG